VPPVTAKGVTPAALAKDMAPSLLTKFAQHLWLASAFEFWPPTPVGKGERSANTSTIAAAI
jgi:hypothetical protein